MKYTKAKKKHGHAYGHWAWQQVHTRITYSSYKVLVWYCEGKTSSTHTIHLPMISGQGHWTGVPSRKGISEEGQNRISDPHWSLQQIRVLYLKGSW